MSRCIIDLLTALVGLEALNHLHHEIFHSATNHDPSQRALHPYKPEQSSIQQMMIAQLSTAVLFAYFLFRGFLQRLQSQSGKRQRRQLQQQPQPPRTLQLKSFSGSGFPRGFRKAVSEDDLKFLQV
jgi:hypothetical protein